MGATDCVASRSRREIVRPCLGVRRCSCLHPIPATTFSATMTVVASLFAHITSIITNTPNNQPPKSCPSPRSFKSRFRQLFELVQKVILPPNCRSSGKFVLNSPSTHTPESYENRRPTIRKRRYQFLSPTSLPNNTTNYPRRDIAAGAAISGNFRQFGGKSGNLAATKNGAKHHFAANSQISAAIFSAIMIVVAFVFARITSGITDASTTINPSTACISHFGDTTAIASESGPILQVPDE